MTFDYVELKEESWDDAINLPAVTYQRECHTSQVWKEDS